MHIQHWAGTDVGLVRDSNDDAFLWLGPNDTGRGYLWLVADGMGGTRGGAVASSIVVRTVAEMWRSTLQSSRDPYEAIDRVLQTANQRIVSLAAQTPDLADMGTTVAMLVLIDHTAWIAHVGDSRVYTLKNLSLKALTTDHTVEAASQLQRKGIVNGPAGSALTRVMGRKGLEVDFGNRQPLPVNDETFLLCTDGAWSVLEDRFIEGALQRLSAKDAVESLAELARLNWSDDNLTIAVVRLAPPSAVMATDRPGFLSWIAGTAPVVGQARTVVFSSANAAANHGTPPSSNVDLKPNSVAGVSATIPSPAVTPGPAVVGGSTTMFSPQQMEELRQSINPGGTTNPLSRQDRATAVKAADVNNYSAPPTGGATTMFSPADMAAVRASSPPNLQGPAPSAGNTQLSAGNASTLQFSSANMDELRRMAGIATSPPPQQRLRERTAALSREEIERLREAADQESAPPPARKKWPFVLAALLILALASITIAFILWAPKATDGTVNVDGSALAALAPAEYEPPPPLVPPPSPTAPDGQHALDQMPYFRIPVANLDGSTTTLLIDAHEVLTHQMVTLRSTIPDVELVYRTAAAPLFEFLPCDGLTLDSSTGTSTRPACASPEAAEVYCNALGRQLPTVEQWQSIIATRPEIIAPSRGRIWRTRSDGPPPPTDASTINGIYNVYDGLAEILRVDRAIVAMGDMPLLQPSSTGSPMTMAPGLLRDLRARTLTQDQVPLLGFRCVTIEAPLDIPVVADVARPVDPAAAPRGLTAPPGTAPGRPDGTVPPPSATTPPSPPIDPAPGTLEPPDAVTASSATPPGGGPTPPAAAEAGTAAAPSRIPGGDPAAAAPPQSQAERERERRRQQAAAEPTPAPPTTATGRVQLMDPVYLPATLEEYEEQVEERTNAETP